MRNLKLIALAALTTGILIIMTTGCKKGDTGPVGPAGPDSVQYSAWNTLAMTVVGTDTDGNSIYGQTITASSITSTILNKGSVIGYLLVNDPLTANGDSSVVNASLALQEFFAIGKIDLVSYGTDYSGYLYRYVVIPSKVATSSTSGSIRTYTSDQLKQLDYTTLSTILKIPASGSSLK